MLGWRKVGVGADSCGCVAGRLVTAQVAYVREVVLQGREGHRRHTRLSFHGPRGQVLSEGERVV